MNWIKEFYTEASVSEELTIMVRGVPVYYSPEAINAYLGITPPEKSEFDSLSQGCSQAQLDKIHRTIGTEKAKWFHKGRSGIFSTKFQKPKANMWFYFLRHTLHPTSHDTNLCIERVFVVYCIIERKPFDVGRLICSNIHVCIDGN